MKQILGFLLAFITLLLGNTPLVHAVTLSSLSFDGSYDYLTSVQLPNTSEFTVEGWVKRTGDLDYYETFFSDTNRQYSKGTFTVFVDGGELDCGTSPSDQFAFYDVFSNTTLCSGVKAQIGTWYHVAVTKNATGMVNLYVNGALTDSGVFPPQPSYNGIITIGRAGEHPSEHFKGLIDEVRISNTPVYTAAFTRPQDPFSSSANTILLYHLDAASGQVVTDSSENNRDGVLGSTSSSETSDPLWSTDSPFAADPTPTQVPGPTNTPGPGSTNTPGPVGGTAGKQGDLNNDGKVNIFDLSILLRNFGKSGQGDLNNSGKVDIFDLSILLRNFGK